MATPANNSQQALCQIVPVYSTEQAQSVRIWINQMIKAARWTECTTIMFEFVPATASACREVLGPMKINGIQLLSRIRRLEEGFVMWVPPWPPDRQPPPKREVTVYPPPAPKPALPPGAEAFPSEGAEEIDTPEDEGEEETGEEPPEPPPTPPANPARVRTRAEAQQRGKPRPLSHRGVKLDPQQPPISPEEDLSGGGQIRRVRQRVPKDS